MRIRIGLMTLPILRFLRELFRPNPSPIHRNTRVTRVDDLIRVVTLHATVMASGSLSYLTCCGVNQYDHSTIDTRFKLQKVFFSVQKLQKRNINMNFKKTAFMATIATIAFAPAAFAVNHDETFPRMLEMVTSASPAELDKIKDGFCKGQLAATMTASDIRGRAAELASDDFTEQQIFDLAGRVAVEFSTVYANICK